MGCHFEASACDHIWVFTTPGHIKCTRCLAIGQRWFTPQEKREHKGGLWIYLTPRA